MAEAGTLRETGEAYAYSVDTKRHVSVAFALLTPGSVVTERYEILHLLGRGGMGQVYLAYDRLMGEQIALKTLGNLESEAPCELLAEARLARHITHPNVCRVYDVGIHNGRHPIYFMTMEYINGLSLRMHVERGPLRLDEALDLAAQLLVGLKAVHEAGILHRDLKTDNVLVRRRKQNGASAVITDFGCASPTSWNSRLPVGDSPGFQGSIAYMAPEQLEGRSVGIETDLYCFGLVLYEILTGKLPFAEQTPASMILRRLKEAPPPPSAARPGLSPTLDDFVLRCLRHMRPERFCDAASALMALRRCAARERQPS